MGAAKLRAWLQQTNPEEGKKPSDREVPLVRNPFSNASKSKGPATKKRRNNDKPSSTAGSSAWCRKHNDLTTKPISQSRSAMSGIKIKFVQTVMVEFSATEFDLVFSKILAKPSIYSVGSAI